ncbi:MAG: pteridine-dependent deoxygenase [Povalibacter sp.]
MQAKELTAALPDAGESIGSESGVRVAYHQGSATDLPANVLAAVHFGAQGGDTVKNSLRVQVRLRPLNGSAYTELWLAQGPVKLGHSGIIRYACDAQHVFGVIELDEREHGDVAAATAVAYAAIAEFQRHSEYPHLLRMWNYLDAINEGFGDLERYRQFCIGRARGLAGIQNTAFPAATAIGHQHTTNILQVFWLAGRWPGTPIENPRQVSAYRYPRLHGPVSPTFARATLAPDHALLISGTASIVGHSSVHDDDVQAQLDETIRNLSTLRALAGRASGPSLLKAYVRNPEQAQSVAERLSATLPPEFRDSQIIYLAADVCRRELLLEIEGVQLASTQR